MILNVVDGGFEKYGSDNYWKVSQSISTKQFETQSSAHDDEKIEVFLEANDIENFLKLDFRKLDQRNDNDIIKGFIHPFYFEAIKKRAGGFIKDKSNSDVILQNLQKFLDNYLQRVKNDSSDENYRRFKNAYQSVQRIINNQ